MRFSAIRRVASTGSTNDDMLALLGEDEARGLTIATDFQTHGSGRKGRAWIAPPGSALLFTTALPEPIPARDLWIVPFWIGVAVHDALAALGIDTQLQWPNDVLLDGSKLAGILCISRVLGDEAWAACGVGINLTRPSDPSALGGIDPAPAFVSDTRATERDDVLRAILGRADASYEMLHSPGDVTKAWERAAHIPGADYRLRLDQTGEIVEGMARSLSAGGALVVDAAAGPRIIAQADARVLR
jgi:BirA family biotin operon repressor/biotin-[acetyl-CoA-carboxylase] ligase